MPEQPFPFIGRALRLYKNFFANCNSGCRLYAFACAILRRKKKKTLKTDVFKVFFDGGDKRDRTAGLLNAIQALSHLSYTPMLWSG